MEDRDLYTGKERVETANRVKDFLDDFDPDYSDFYENVGVDHSNCPYDEPVDELKKVYSRAKENLNSFASHYQPQTDIGEMYLEKASQCMNHFWDIVATMNRCVRDEIPEWAELINEQE